MAGPSWTHRLAVHEAGHVVAALALGLEVTSVSIERGYGAGGVTYVSTSEGLDRVLLGLAGTVAEHLTFGPAGAHVAHSDREMQGSDVAIIGSARALARELLADRFEQVHRIALALLEGPGTLDAAELRAAAGAVPRFLMHQLREEPSLVRT